MSASRLSVGMGTNQTLRPECSPAPGVGQCQSSALIPRDKPLLQRAQPPNVCTQSPSFLCPTWELPRYPKGAHSPQKWVSKQKRRRKDKFRTAGGLFPLPFPAAMSCCGNSEVGQARPSWPWPYPAARTKLISEGSKAGGHRPLPSFLSYNAHGACIRGTLESQDNACIPMSVKLSWVIPLLHAIATGQGVSSALFWATWPFTSLSDCWRKALIRVSCC